ncbi:MAG: sulfatase-like hydrolase/transferase [Planctomycetota bacterium]|nr:sulfatase-like hydrolase/transferase [Planctomycetota bacterium]
MKTIFVATAGALLGTLVALVVFGALSESDSMLWRETVFALSCNALFCGVVWLPLSKIRPATNFKFDFIAGTLLASGGWFAIPMAFVKRANSSLEFGFAQRLGKIAYLLPAVAFFVLPQLRELPPMIERPNLKLSQEDVAASSSAPNVLMVIVDTLRADTILDPEVSTPNMDALRERGTWAEYAVAPCNQTLPSHLVMLTGLDIEKIGMRGNLSRWPTTELLADNKCMPIAERFKLSGYNTAAVSTNMLLSSVNEEAGHQGFDDGFDTWHGINYKSQFEDLLQRVLSSTLMGQILPTRLVTFPLNRLLFPNDIKHFLPHFKEGERTTDSALDYIKELQEDSRPYFFLAQYFDPHSPYIAPTPQRGMHARSDERPAGISAAPEDEFFMRVELRSYCRNDERPDNFQPLSDYLHNLYREEVVYFDQQLGRLLKQVSQGDRETIVVFVSDHGEGFGDHRNVEHGETLYNEEVLVPFIIAGPGVPEGKQLDFAPDLIDATYTMLELADVPIANVDGQSVLNEAYAQRPLMSFMINHVSMISDGYKLHAKLVYPSDEEPYELTPIAIYDLNQDAGETNNLIEKSPELLEKFEQQIAARLANDLFPFISERELTGQQESQLNALGYTE